MFQGSKAPLIKWFVAIYLLTPTKKGVSFTQLSRYISIITYKTARFINHLIRECFGIVVDEKLDGEVELDETFVGGKDKNRHRNKKVKHTHFRSFRDKAPEMHLLQLGGKVVCKVVRDTSCK
ncbi:IS1595 family transposase [Bacteroides sp.]|uniref:IS1595 family transposase n=1 Tax=Bacteroides sp. TaxID=29523 RepID=UPI003D0969F9